MTRVLTYLLEYLLTYLLTLTDVEPRVLRAVRQICHDEVHTRRRHRPAYGQ